MRSNPSVASRFAAVIASMAALAFACAALPAGAAQLLTNGGFESGLTGWTTAAAPGSEGAFVIQTGTTSPVNADPVPAPAGGTNAAMSDGGGPGTHVLSQDFTVAAPVAQISVSFSLFVGNRSTLFATPNPATLDFGINAANQQVRVDILKATASAFSVDPADVLLTLYQTQPGDALVSGYTVRTTDITSLVNANIGTALRLRFAATDNLAPLQAGIDNVSIATLESDMSVNLAGLPVTASVGSAYSGTILCTNSAAAAAAAIAATCSVSGLPAGVLVGACTPVPPSTVAAGASISCPVSGVPTTVGPAIVTVTTGATNDTITGNDTGTVTINVAGSSDMSVDLSGLPTTATAGDPYAGSFTCTNSAAATAAATGAACGASGLPAGVSVGLCTPLPPATVAAGASIVCQVAGTPLFGGTATVTVTTGAGNDPNTANDAGTVTITVASPPPRVIPTLGGWMLGLLALLLAVSGTVRRRT